MSGTIGVTLQQGVVPMYCWECGRVYGVENATAAARNAARPVAEQVPYVCRACRPVEVTVDLTARWQLTPAGMRAVA